MAITQKEAERRSRRREVLDDVRTDPWVFMDVDRSIAYHRRHDITEPWNEWEWPRRLAALRMTHEIARIYESRTPDPVDEAYEFVQKMKEEGDG